MKRLQTIEKRIERNRIKLKELTCTICGKTNSDFHHPWMRFHSDPIYTYKCLDCIRQEEQYPALEIQDIRKLEDILNEEMGYTKSSCGRFPSTNNRNDEIEEKEDSLEYTPFVYWNDDIFAVRYFIELQLKREYNTYKKQSNGVWSNCNRDE